MEIENYLGTVPPYAILSHTWNDEEITFQELIAQDPVVRSKKGYIKVQKCAAICQENSFGHAWIDTIGIDKTSSAEISEAINSMWKWYNEADFCYLYLEDVASDMWESVGNDWWKDW